MPMQYEFRVDGILSEEARAMLGDMRIIEVPSQTIIRGEVVDESHLLGIIAQLHVLGVTIVSVQPDR